MRTATTARSTRMAVSSAKDRVSNAQLLVKNLRLLDLDEDFDWPGIDIDTFSSRSQAGAGFQQRLHCGVWVFSKLFGIYDADENAEQKRHTHEELSHNNTLRVRTRIFQRLSDLKQTGVLASEIAIRKSMFDECGGAEFEELLAVFSCMVLIRTLERKANRSIGRLNLDTRSLELAYRISIAKHLDERKLLQKHWLKFSRTLAMQSEMMDQRAKRVKPLAPIRTHVPQRRIASLEAFMKEHWTGANQGWIDILLRGDQHNSASDLLDLPYSEVWQHACNDTLHIVRPQQDENCLQSLQSRIQEQKLRLERWKAAAHTYHTARSRHQQQLTTPPSLEKEEVPTRKYSLRSSNARKALAKASDDSSLAPVQDTRRTSRHRPSLSVSSGIPSAVSVASLVVSENRKPMANTGKRLSSAAHLVRPRKDDRLSPVQAVVALEKEVTEPGTENSTANSIIETDHSLPLTLAERTKISLANMGTRLDRNTLAKKQIESPTPAIADEDTLAIHRRPQLPFARKQSIASQPGNQPKKPRISAVYPPNQLEASRKENIRDTSFFDETIIDLDEVDIFKSRPKVALSPRLLPRTNGDMSMLSLVADDTNNSSEDDFS